MQVIAQARRQGLHFYCEKRKVDPTAPAAGGGVADNDAETLEEEGEEEEQEEDVEQEDMED